MSQKINNLADLVNSAKEDSVKFFEKNNSAAGVRLRKTMQSVKELANEIRADVQNKKKES